MGNWRHVVSVPTSDLLAPTIVDERIPTPLGFRTAVYESASFRWYFCSNIDPWRLATPSIERHFDRLGFVDSTVGDEERPAHHCEDERPARTKYNYGVRLTAVCLTAHGSLLTARRSRLVAHGSLLTARCSRLVARRSPSRSSSLGPRSPRRSLFRGVRKLTPRSSPADSLARVRGSRFAIPAHGASLIHRQSKR